ncbi:Major Facilitator Superfamily Domain-Containing Protein 3 [Manis pentadactyla]|nr:Major Facilitator Superfamily Domain-Containing Protein 3 [Manis pentadactyla]
MAIPGTLWTVGFVFIYKLGEQGASSLFPLLLLDQGISTRAGAVEQCAGPALLPARAWALLLARHRKPLSLLKSVLPFCLGDLACQLALLFQLDAPGARLGPGTVLRGAA